MGRARHVDSYLQTDPRVTTRELDDGGWRL